MKVAGSLLFVLASAAAVSGQTIAALLQTYAAGVGNFTSLSKTAALISTHPEWASAGTKTLLVAPDATLNASSTELGFLFTDTVALDWPTAPKYAILTDTSATGPICVYDNYNSGMDLHFRTGIEDVTALAGYRGSNGWLYVLSGPLSKLRPLSTVLAGTFGATRQSYRDLITKAQLTSTLDSLQGVTFLLPSDTAVAAVQTRLSTLTTAQLQYVIAHNILTIPLYSNLIGAGPYTNLNGVSMAVVSAANAAGEFTTTIGNSTLSIPADITTLNGPGHAMSSFVIPATIPATAGFPTIPLNNRLAGAATTAAAVTTTRTTVAVATTKTVTSIGLATLSGPSTTTAAAAAATTTKSSAASRPGAHWAVILLVSAASWVLA